MYCGGPLVYMGMGPSMAEQGIYIIYELFSIASGFLEMQCIPSLCMFVVWKCSFQISDFLKLYIMMGGIKCFTWCLKNLMKSTIIVLNGKCFPHLGFMTPPK